MRASYLKDSRARIFEQAGHFRLAAVSAAAGLAVQRLVMEYLHRCDLLCAAYRSGTWRNSSIRRLISRKGF